MVFIIKTNNGQRTARILESGTKKCENLADIIEALKGMTLKLEIDIKIADIVPNTDEQSQSQNPTPAETPRQQEEVSNRDRLNHEEKVVNRDKFVQEKIVGQDKPHQEQIHSNRNISPQEDKTIIDQVAGAKLHDSPAASVRFGLSQNQQAPVTELKTSPSYVDKKDELGNMRSYESPLEPIRKKLGRPKLIKGSLKIGHRIQAYAIAVTSSEPLLAYIPYDFSKLHKIVDMIVEIVPSIESQSKMSKINIGDIVFAQSADDNQWYRAIVEESTCDEVKVYHFDWGIYETLSPDRLRHLLCPDLGLSSFPACAVKVDVSPKSQEYKEEFFEMANTFDLMVESYNDYKDSYMVMILGKV